MHTANTTAPPGIGARAESTEIDLLGWGFAQDPHSRYALLRAAGDVRKHVVKTLATELNAWVVADYERARSLLADPRLSKQIEPLLDAMAANAVDPTQTIARTPRSMLFSDPPDHTRLRRLLGNVFTMRRVERLRPWIEELTDSLLDQVVPGEEFDFVERIGLALPIFVIGKLLGVPQERHDDFRAWNGVLASLQTTAEQKREAHGRAFAYIGELIAAKRREPGDDLVSALITAQEDGGSLDDPELLATTYLMMNAGYETTAHMLSSGVLGLLEHPDQQRLLRADSSLLSSAVEEFLRLESPLNMATIRFTAEPVELGGTTIPAGQIVFIALLSANRDPARFPDPDRLDITRANKGHLSFGHGIHHCIGAPLARMEGEIVFGRLLERFATWELVTPAQQLRWKYSAQFRGLEALPVRLS
ncbi:cytochrome P450 [Actinocrinis puniceicyclus]|uniref:Cytochrome P450 n=1 Tax=Actinocrinis puniceicyclus TaxID=977794 RepID=A0A8J8BDS4_9ACTN|nr:cytochrome P450 [Actinocrinis puniceicyclus]MBS2966547.1 cytochrome P450 [Actinocrinis puniceicyclus]